MSISKSWKQSPDWENVRKIPGYVALTIAVPVLVMADFSRSPGDADLSAWLILMCGLFYMVSWVGFQFFGLFAKWGPEGSTTARNRMIKASNFYMEAKNAENPTIPGYLEINEISSDPVKGPELFTLYDSRKDFGGHRLCYGKTQDGMTERVAINEQSPQTFQVTAEEFRILKTVLASLKAGSKTVILAQSDLSQLAGIYGLASTESGEIIGNASLLVDRTNERN